MSVILTIIVNFVTMIIVISINIVIVIIIVVIIMIAIILPIVLKAIWYLTVCKNQVSILQNIVCQFVGPWYQFIRDVRLYDLDEWQKE